MKHDPEMFKLHEAYEKHRKNGQLGHCHIYDKQANRYIELHLRCCASCGAFFGFYEDFQFTGKTAKWQGLAKYMAQDEPRIHEAILSTRNRRIAAAYAQYKRAVAAGDYSSKEFP
jgi:hypothetical protein